MKKQDPPKMGMSMKKTVVPKVPYAAKPTPAPKIEKRTGSPFNSPAPKMQMTKTLMPKVVKSMAKGAMEGASEAVGYRMNKATKKK